MSRRRHEKKPQKKPQQPQQKVPMSIAVEPREDVDPFNDPENRTVRHLYAEVQDVLTSYALQRASLYVTAMEMDLLTDAQASSESEEKPENPPVDQETSATPPDSADPGFPVIEMERLLLHIEPDNGRYLILKMLVVLSEAAGDKVATRLLETMVESEGLAGHEKWRRHVDVTPITPTHGPAN